MKSWIKSLMNISLSKCNPKKLYNLDMISLMSWKQKLIKFWTPQKYKKSKELERIGKASLSMWSQEIKRLKICRIWSERRKRSSHKSKNSKKYWRNRFLKLKMCILWTKKSLTNSKISCSKHKRKWFIWLKKITESKFSLNNKRTFWQWD